MDFREAHSKLVGEASTLRSQIRWCDEERFREENTEYVSPGQFLNPWGYFVVGTTIGGNAIVLGTVRNEVFFVDHTWYADDEIYYQDLAGEKQWIDLPYSDENMLKSLFTLGIDKYHFLADLRSGKIDQTLNEID